MSVSSELNLTWYLTDLTQAIMREIHLSSKPNRHIMFSRKIHSTLSEALCISSLTAQAPFTPDLLFFYSMDALISKENIISNKTPWNKGTLHRGYYLRK
jgi:hypothetical protein